MARAIATLPDRQARDLLNRYGRAVVARRIKVLGVIAAIVVLVAVTAVLADVRPATFFRNLWHFGSYIGKTFPVLGLSSFSTDIAEWYWNLGRWLSLLVDTLLIAFLGTFWGALGAFVLCFLASANLVRGRVIRFAARRLLEFCRTVPDIVFALIFVIAFGLGPMAGVLALTIHTLGALGKLFSEVVENIDMRPLDGLAAAGGSWIQTVRFAVLPQVLPGFASYALLRFEINVRGAGVMGFVGAGGIGQELLVAIRNFYYTDVSAILLMIIVTVVTIDLVTERVRHGLIGFEARG